ncbi:MAG: FAD-dependent oxidoreductase [Verrucomicrobiota bacterium]
MRWISRCADWLTNLDLSFFGRTVVVTTGTFLRALMHVGKNKNEGGRMGDFNAKTLSTSFQEAGIELERLKTGTPPRILGSSVDFSKLEEQTGDREPTLFAHHDTRGSLEDRMFHVERPGQSFQGWQPGTEQVSCWITYTNEKTASIIQDNLHLSAMYSGEISGVGPRYCPSIEDKVVRFADKDRHQLFLEPEGRHTDEWYINGISTSLPFSVQVDMLRSVEGLHNVTLMRAAYAVEYDFAPPTQLFPSLESKKVENLFFAGQINGTSGYEEAGGQGLIAGMNAVLKTRGESPVVLGRHQAYIGVLIDDLVTKGTQEPYRMFTSRAEYRLLLNHHSAELRLLETVERCALVRPDRLERMKEKAQSVDHWAEKLNTDKTKGGTWGDYLRRNEAVHLLPEAFRNLSPGVRDEVLYRVKYQGYLERELRNIEKLKNVEHVKIPNEFDFKSIKGMRAESIQKLESIRPQSLGQASRISGINPADISILLVMLEARRGSAV